MINVTEYVKLNNKSTAKISKFLALVRVKYYIGASKKVETKRGRHGAYTLFSEDLFELFLGWEQRKPIPLLNRKVYEINWFISCYYEDAIFQYKMGDYIYDWYIPSLKLLVEFNETDSHYAADRKTADMDKRTSAKGYNHYVIKEKTAMVDLALMCKTYLIKQPSVQLKNLKIKS